MSYVSSVTNVTATTARWNIADVPPDGVVEVQYSTRRDFQFCVTPTVNAGLAANVDVAGLNADTVYYLRARDRRASGAVGDWSTIVTPFRTGAGAARNTAPAAVMIEPAILVTPLVGMGFDVGGLQAGYPAENLLRDSPVAMRKAQNYASGHVIDVATSGELLDTVALLNTNLPETANWYVQAWSARPAGGGALIYTSPTSQFRASPALPSRPGYHGLLRLADMPRAFPWLRIVIDNAPTPGGILHAEHLVFGLNRKSKNHALEKTETPIPMTSVDRRRSGGVDRVRGLPMRKVDFELQMLSEAQYETIYGDLWRYENEAVLCVPNSKSGAFFHDRILFGDLTGGKITNPASPRYVRGLTINSII